MDNTTILRVCLAISTGYLVRLASKAPNPPASKTKPYSIIETKGNSGNGLFRRVLTPTIFFAAWGISIAMIALYEVVVYVLASQIAGAEPLYHLFCPTPSTLPITFQTTPLFLLGSTLTITGCVLRLWCFATMGKLFTFELGIAKDHHLVTSGPYSFVRHPAYLGGLLIFAGLPLQFALPDSGAIGIQCGWMGGVGETLATSVAVIGGCLALTVFSVARARKEDEEMSRTFKGEWEAWSRAVKWKLVPGVY